MSKLIFSVFLGLALFYFQSAQAASSLFLKTYPANQTVYPYEAGTPFGSIQQFLSLSPKQYEKLTGSRLNFKQKILLRITQLRLKRHIKKYENFNTAAFVQRPSKFHFGGFILGFLLSILGVFIAYLIGDRKIIWWAWRGFAASSVIILLLILLGKK